jgi:hypothetical protein
LQKCQPVKQSLHICIRKSLDQRYLVSRKRTAPKVLWSQDELNVDVRTGREIKEVG